MNGVHDMGGMHGLGPIEREENEPVFHSEWERRVLAFTLAVGAWGRSNIDHRRFTRERIPGPAYLRMSYYEKWLAGVVTEMVDVGLLTWEEAVTGMPAPDAAKQTPPLTAEQAAAALARGGPTERDAAVKPRFQAGDRVRTRNLHPPGHTRLPRYARGKAGTIAAHYGAHVFPDTNAHGQGEQPHPLYSVRFEAQALWGPEAAARHAVYLDLWEPYLEPA